MRVKLNNQVCQAQRRVKWHASEQNSTQFKWAKWHGNRVEDFRSTYRTLVLSNKRKLDRHPTWTSSSRINVNFRNRQTFPADFRRYKRTLFNRVRNQNYSIHLYPTFFWRLLFNAIRVLESRHVFSFQQTWSWGPNMKTFKGTNPNVR